jgi:hypothetical protein
MGVKGKHVEIGMEPTEGCSRACKDNGDDDDVIRKNLDSPRIERLYHTSKNSLGTGKGKVSQA